MPAKILCVPQSGSSAKALLGERPSCLWLAWLAGTAVASLPLLATPFPPLGQHFFNLVRMQILAHPALYARDFTVRWDAIPDLGMDLTVPLLSVVMPVEQACRLFLFAALALLTSGAALLSRVVNRRWSVLPLASFLLLYNWILVRGYENNLAGLGLCLWALAAHIALRHAPIARVLVSTCSALVLYFCHLFALGVFALVIGAWEVGCLLTEGHFWRRSMVHAAAVLLPLVPPCILLWRSSTGQLVGSIEFAPLMLWFKIKLCIEVLTVGDRLGDALLLASLAAATVLALARRWLRCEPECRLLLVLMPLIAVFAPLYAFSSFGVVERSAIAFAFLLTALLGLRGVDTRLQRAMAVALALVFLIRIGIITADWRAADQMIAAYQTAFATLERGSVLLQFDQDVGYPSPLGNPHRWNPPLDKVVTLATLDGMLVPLLYLKVGQQPVLYRTEDASLRAFQLDIGARLQRFADDAVLHAWLMQLRERFPDLQKRFSTVYVAIYDPERRLSPSIPDAQLVATLPEHRLYRL
jgi:hypothetical protein